MQLAKKRKKSRKGKKLSTIRTARDRALRLISPEYLPLFQILGEMHPGKRQLLISHLNPRACNNLSRCTSAVLAENQMPNLRFPQDVSTRLQAAVRENPSEFKHILLPSASSHKRRTALTRVGAGPLALVLSTAIPWLLGLLMNRKKK